MIAEFAMGGAALISAGGGIYAVIVSKSVREATTKKTAGEAADLITEAAGRFTMQLQEQADKTAARNRELVEALNTLIDVLDEVLEKFSHDGAVMGVDGCSDRKANKAMIAQLRLATRAAKLAT